MEVRLRVPPALRPLCDGRPSPVFDLGERAQATVADLLDAVAAAHPALERRVRDEQGVLRPHVNLFVGDSDVRSLGGTGAALRHGAEVSILAAISGG